MEQNKDVTHDDSNYKKRTRTNMSHTYADSFMANDLVHAAK